ncbi:MAG: DNA recombination/repair protein RecA, partial [Candidatus Cloacimonetes bacterium]|nr:DNA recombination/repair protein RecA [Candidatus Cloacimonadota bacterium]
AGVITRSGTWFSFGEERLGQGRDNVKTLLKERPELFADLEAKVRAAVGLVYHPRSSGKSSDTLDD